MTTNQTGIELRSFLLDKAKRRLEQVDVAGIGRIFIQSLTERERGEIETAPAAETCARLIATCLVDEEGHRLFSDAELPTVLALDSKYTQPIFNAIAKHCSPFATTGQDSEADIKN